MPSYLVANLSLWLDEDESLLASRAAAKLAVTGSDIRELRVVRKVLDARKRNHPRFVYTVEVGLAGGSIQLGGDVQALAALPEARLTVRQPDLRPLIVGAGPAGLFCALALLERGVRSTLVERGKPVDSRRKDVAQLFRSGHLDPESNMNFGEGGAGAYTDGKLSTRIHHPQVRRVIETFARFGGVSRILVEGKPHVGSDLLPCAVEALRIHLQENGCEFRWQSRVEDLVYRDGTCQGVRLHSGEVIESDRVVLAPGNSARELYERFATDGRVAIEAKPFAAGFRAEHPQELIDAAQYGAACGNPKLPPADYKLAENPEVSGGVRGVYSFCMCPGGIVVPTPTEDGLQCTNGMSNSHRNAHFANAGVVVSVSLEDFAREGFHGPLAGLSWQRKWEREAYALGDGGYRAPAMRISSFLSGGRPGGLGKTTYRPGLTPADLNRLFPEAVQAPLKVALRRFDRKIRGFASSEGVLMGIESRTSSPVRITRGEDLQSISLKGLYPSGEGCGYAGGIVSSAVDGLRIADRIGEELGG